MDDAEKLPVWVRVLFALLGAGFGSLGAWLFSVPSEPAWATAAGATASSLIALVLLVTAIRGRIWPWLYLLFG